ncbi:MAG: DUF1566 domain-containing protein [Proteobacteria bacterium]|nr:DUF1566 domain-containing protein [Desulfobulbaceae bacterium]MBU4152113.1 DUF1566 domain-containing protein [Pseudomonadota bacterium]
MKKIFGCTLTAMGFMAGTALAGNLDSPALPSSATSAMPTITGIYNQLATGAPAQTRTGAFTEPIAAPASSSRTLAEVLTKVPTADNINGARPSDVSAGKNYWSLRTDSTWGLQAGTSLSAKVPKTGQATCYDASGATISCSNTGQDGALKPGVAWPNPRFTDNGNGTVTDNLTSLIWLKNANCTATVGEIPKSLGTLTWTNALTWSNNLASGACGLNDNSVAGNWRLPSRAELISLVSLEYTSPALTNTAGTTQWSNNNPFSTVQSNYYWSSSTSIANKSNAWGVDFNDGSVTSNNAKINSNYIWPVRGGN